MKNKALFVPYEKSGVSRLNYWLASIMSLVVLMQVFAYGPHLPMNIYYAVIGGLSIVILAQNSRALQPNTQMFAFWGIMWLSIMMNYGDIRPEYQSGLRTFSFALVLLVVGPFFQSASLLSFRRLVLQFLNIGMWAMTMLSFVGYVLHFLPKDRGGYYLGCSVHSMLMAAIAGGTALNCLHEAMQSDNTPKRRNYFLAMFGASVIVTTLAASRAALGSVGCASLAYIALTYKGRIFGAVKIVLTIAILGMVLLQFTGSVTGALTSKMGAASRLQGADSSDDSNVYTLDNLTMSRQSLWEDRLNEISHHPLFGVGAHSIREELCHGETISGSGQVEPGNGWLFIFSSMGIFAFVLFISLMSKPILFFWYNGHSGTDSCLLFGQLVFFAVYMMAEAFITAAGSFSFFYCWLVVANSLQLNKVQMNESTLRLLPRMMFE